MSIAGIDANTQRIAIGRNHALQAIEWLEIAIYAIERSDFQASDHAIGVARTNLQRAEEMSNERNDR